MRRSLSLVVAALTVTACVAATETPAPSVEPWPDPPAVGDEPLEADVAAAVDTLVTSALKRPPEPEALGAIAASGDARLAWILSDLLRLASAPNTEAALVEAFVELTGADPRERRFGANPWLAVTNLLIGWDLPAPPGYGEDKATLLLAIEPAWEPFFADEASTLDWRVTTWGGVFADERPSGDTGPCDRACIPSLDDPELTPADGGDWYGDDRIVFGIRVGDEAVAFPKHIMEVHEMVNLTLGGRRIGLPYCTLCASAQAYLTDEIAGFETLVLRTSGLLSRSNKVMYDLVTGSAFHTFTGEAASGPLREAGVRLEQVSVTVSTWGEWKRAQPDTRIVARDGGIGRIYPDDPLCGRDDAGPIFPTGPTDTRLPAQASVVGVLDPEGAAVAFAADLAQAELVAGRPVTLAGVELIADSAGILQARTTAGDALASHQAFWFAWSQFHPETALWAPPLAGESRGISGPPSGEPPPTDSCQGILDVLERDAGRPPSDP